MANPIVQFVDSPSPTTVRYDFNATTPTLRCLPLGADAINFGVASFTGEPEGVGGVYGYRQIQFTQRIIGSRAVALARMSLLAKEIFRATNWLKFQWDPSAAPVYFKTYRAEPGTLSLENAGSAGAWDVVVPLMAEGFAYGARQTLSTFQVVQGPVDLTTPTRTAMRVVLPAIRGDAPTALRVTVKPAATTSQNTFIRFLLGLVAGETSMSDPVVEIGTADGFTAGTGTGAATTTSGSAYFGGSYRVVTVSPNDLVAGNNFAERLTGSFPVVPAGRYKVMLRCEADAAVATFQRTYMFALGTGSTGLLSYLPSRSVAINPANISLASYFQGWVDLGDITLPFGIDPATDVAGTMPGGAFGIKIGTTDNTAGVVRIDALKLIPIARGQVWSANMLAALWDRNPIVNGLRGTFDGDSETYSCQNASNQFQPSAPSLQGSYLVADPNAPQNLLIVMATSAGTTGGSQHATTYPTSLNLAADVDVSYYPRYLHIGDGT